MNDNKWSTEEQIFTEQLKEIYNEDNVEIPRLDMSFLDRTYDASKVKARTPRILKVAAVIMLMIISSLATALLITEGYVEAFKDDIAKRIFTWRSGVVVTEESWSSDEQSEMWEFSDSNLILELVEVFPEIKTPQYIPKGYEFQNAMIEQLADNSYIATFNYSKDDDLLTFIQMPNLGDENIGSSSNGEVIKLSDRIITTWDDFDSEIHGSTIIMKDSTIQVSTTKIETEELIKVAKGLQ